MKWKIVGLFTCLNVISAVILVGGFGSAIWIYETAKDNPSGVFGYEQEGGSVYPIMPEDSKKYQRDLELYGGKAIVLADKFRRGFVGLWHGKALAFTVACISIIISYGFFYASNHLPSSLKSAAPGEKRRDGKHNSLFPG